jgi:hypothetical protein
MSELRLSARLCVVAYHPPTQLLHRSTQGIDMNAAMQHIRFAA